MELVGLYQKRSAIPAVSIQLPWFGRVVLSLLTSIIIVVIVIIVAAHRELSNPFSAFSYLFDDDARQAALASGFTCQEMTLPSYTQTLSSYCSQRNIDKTFSGIFLWMSGNHANEISFSLRENTLTLGDLALLWGQPEIRLYCETVVAAWPGRRMSALLAAPRTGHTDYFSPVLSVSFTRSGAPQWGRMLMNDALHNCGTGLV